MPDYNSKNIKYPSQFAIFLGLTIGGLIIGSLASFAIWTMMTGEPFPLKAEDILQPKYYQVNMVLQAVSTFFIFFVPVQDARFRTIELITIAVIIKVIT